MINRKHFIKKPTIKKNINNGDKVIKSNNPVH